MVRLMIIYIFNVLLITKFFSFVPFCFVSVTVALNSAATSGSPAAPILLSSVFLTTSGYVVVITAVGILVAIALETLMGIPIRARPRKRNI